MRLQKPVAQWQQEQVTRWLASLGMQDYEAAFKGVTGQASSCWSLAGCLGLTHQLTRFATGAADSAASRPGQAHWR